MIIILFIYLVLISFYIQRRYTLNTEIEELREEILEKEFNDYLNKKVMEQLLEKDR